MIMPGLAQFMRLSRVCVRRSSCLASCLTSVCVGRLVSRLVSRLCASVVLSHVLSRVCVRRSSCLASVSRLCASVVLSRVYVHLSRVCLASVCVCVRLSRVGRLISRLCASACGNWLILCVGRHSKSLKVGGTGSGFCYLSRVILSPCCTYRLCRLYEQTFNILI